jgi:hypothetical protein
MYRLGLRPRSQLPQEDSYCEVRRCCDLIPELRVTIWYNRGIDVIYPLSRPCDPRLANPRLKSTRLDLSWRWELEAIRKE